MQKNRFNVEFFNRIGRFETVATGRLEAEPGISGHRVAKVCMDADSRSELLSLSQESGCFLNATRRVFCRLCDRSTYLREIGITPIVI
jgi:hypothetical protein